MPLIYGEGRQKALSRLLKEIWESCKDGSPALPSMLSTVPYIRNPDFVDRPNILAWIREKGSLGKPTSRIALVGVGGVGKSQIAIEYAYSIGGPPSTLILWVYAGSRAGLEQSYRDIADANRIPGRDQLGGDILGLVRKWLRTECQTPWVMILDNVDDRSMAEYVDKFIPQNGFVLVTSRNEDAAAYLVGDHTNIITVGPMRNENALALLRKKLRREVEWDDGKASDLVRALDHIPLAVSQAAAFLNDKASKYSLSRYLDEIRIEGEKGGFLEKAYRDLWRDLTDFEQANSVVLTWHKSFRSIQAERPTAAALLSVLSFFDRQEIPEILVYISGARSHGFYHIRNISRDDIDEDIYLLKKYAFLSQDVKSNGYRMHRLVQLSLRKWLESTSRFTRTKEESLLAILEALPTPDQEDWIKSRVLLPHAEAILSFAPFRKPYLLPYTTLCHTTAYYARAWKGHQALQGTVKTAATRTQTLFNPKDVLALNCGFSLSWLFLADGKYNEAAKWARQVLEGREIVLGPDNLDTLSAYSSLALMLRYQGKYQEAELISRKARIGFKTALGIDHPKTQKSNNILASILLFQGKYKEGEKLFLELVNAQKRVLGEEHPDTLTSMGDLALTYGDQGRWKEAEELGVQVMDTRKRVLGEEHPDTLTSMGNLASTFWDQGRWKEAEELEVQVMETRKRVLGEEHPDTLTSMGNLASTYRSQGRWEEAEELEVQVMETRKRVLGEEHPDTLTSMGNLASTYRNQGRWKEAEELGVQVMHARKRVLGEEHPDTLTSMGNLASTFWNQGRWKEAEELGVQVMETRKRVLGEEHPDTLTSMANLAHTRKSQSQNEEAISFMKKCFKLQKQILGPHHPNTESSLEALNRWQVDNLEI
ncbi:TPR-like protein [Lindgomyces ingoldianus]|uniref:TPR-like protein n=1 Tax=Lindgomyces ingoldianus TaxID=673940 RepID=A0ACB6QCT1_9PLEO|nr:TPR-like protein [Lindgomyces ingoldianus]KAF2464739.1 TPR-like protein [Lindgomyces ingoldianus]